MDTNKAGNLATPLSALTELSEEIEEIAKVSSGGPGKRIEALSSVRLLRDLPQTKAAGANIWKELDAVDALIQAAVERLRDSPRHYQAARALLGLAEDAREDSWTSRQRKAAGKLNLSFDGFRKRPMKELLCMVAENVRQLGDQVPQSFKADVVALATQEQCEQELLAYIRDAKPRRALLLEYSGATMGRILHELGSIECAIELLVCHPDAAVTDWQRRRITASINNIRDIELNGYRKIGVRFYRTPAALRGRFLGEYVILGWYTYRGTPRAIGLWGHDNAVIVARTQSESGAILANWFCREFENLWNHEETAEDAELYPGVEGSWT